MAVTEEMRICKTVLMELMPDFYWSVSGMIDWMKRHEERTGVAIIGHERGSDLVIGPMVFRHDVFQRLDKTTIAEAIGAYLPKEA